MFMRIQRIAEKGYQSIRIILDEITEVPIFDLDPLITELYAWGSDLRLVGGPRMHQQVARIQAAYSIADGTTSGTLHSPRTLTAISSFIRDCIEKNRFLRNSPFSVYTWPLARAPEDVGKGRASLSKTQGWRFYVSY
jgi:hypothetical protein